MKYDTNCNQRHRILLFNNSNAFLLQMTNALNSQIIQSITQSFGY